MKLSVKESKRLGNLISSVTKRINDEQNSDPHSAAFTRIMNSSDPSRSPIPGSFAGSTPIRDSISSKRRKRKEKSYKLHDYIRKHIDDELGVTHLETPSKRRKLVQKQLTFSTGLETTNNEKSKKKRKRQKVDENQSFHNSGLSSEEQDEFKSLSKRGKYIKKAAFVNKSNSSKIMRNNGNSFAISARKAGRQRLRQVTRWDSPDIDTANDYVRNRNYGTLDRNRFKVPLQKLEKIELLGRLKTAELQSYVFKSVGLNTYPVIASRNPDLKAFCQSMKNKLNAVDCAKFVNEK